MTKPRVTIITLVYNGLPYLKDAIESALVQTHSEFEYLIVDDASPDEGVRKCIESYRDPRIRFIKNEENLGTAASFNKALSMVDSTYVVRLDQDDVNLPLRVEKQIDYLEKNPDISIACSWEYTIDSEGKRSREWKKEIRDYGEFIGPVLLGLCPIWHPSIAFRRADFVDAGGFDAAYFGAEDFEVTARLALERLNAAVVPEFLLLQRQHDTSQSIQLGSKMTEVNHRIHGEAVSRFMDVDDAAKLSSFLRLEKGEPSSEFGKEYVVHMRELLAQLLANVAERQEMSKSEMSSLKKVVYRRLGLGVYCVPVYRWLPGVVFMPVFFVLSPLFSVVLHKLLSRANKAFHEVRYRVKGLNWFSSSVFIN